MKIVAARPASPRLRNAPARRLLPLALAVLLSPSLLVAQGSDPNALNAVHAAVAAEMYADKTDHSAWEYRDHDLQPGHDAVYHVIETPHGNLKRLIQLNGTVLTGDAAQKEIDRIRNYVSSPDLQAHEKKNAQHDDDQARELLQMLPTAFLWQVEAQTPQTITLRFRPNPSFDPPDMQSRVLGIMAGEMVVARDVNRIQTLRGTLTDDVRIGFGILGKIDKGGTFDVERRQLAPGHWQITETHVHIGGRALLFKNIGQQEDEVKTEWRPSTSPNLQVALEQLSH